jgi:hypothetical protein
MAGVTFSCVTTVEQLSISDNDDYVLLGPAAVVRSCEFGGLPC